MTSYWTKRRKINIKVQEHIDAIHNPVSLDEGTDHGQLSDSYNEEESTQHFPSPVYMDIQNNVGESHFQESLIEDLSLPSTSNAVPNTEGTNDDESVCGSVVFSDIDSESSDSDDQNTGVDLASLLVAWVSKFNISHSAVNGLLCILRERHSFLPKDARTLLKTAKQYNILHIAGGCYYHFGIETCVKSIVDGLRISVENITEVSLQINIDGLPLFKSSSVQLWPILGRLVKPTISKPYMPYRTVLWKSKAYQCV